MNKKIAEAVAEDIRLVTDCKPQILDRDSCKSGLGEDVTLILCATVGKSEFLEQMEQSGVFTAAEIKGKREVYKMYTKLLLDDRFDRRIRMIIE